MLWVLAVGANNVTRFGPVVGARVWRTVVSHWVANHHLGAWFGAVGLEGDVPWLRDFLISDGSPVVSVTC